MTSAEIRLMGRVQQVASRVPAVPAAARAYSTWGEHAAGWLALGLAGAVVDRRRRAEWLGVTAAAFGAHAAAVVLKRVVRRPRPDDPAVQVLVRTPSDLSFPSAHAASTTAACVALGGIVGPVPAAALAGGMAVSRVVVGVHYPSDVAAGAAIGAVTGALVRRRVRAAR
ncbi:phosphatase PAP2 family protein [Cellulomonas sp. ACRRI]|uniref:phosphatase PAP2 family protein n=1 Tax=Cellulomonas sp. ACRRI TaxID=2918188 RepID=UPI001EF1B12F|nr:phosphatase PAP2 family protein [Cellulomonas sp. ACRRI]MCG7285439.1 phosphatase PAP2 family protein [Cellulomonas sp. ACRRI]